VLTKKRIANRERKEEKKGQAHDWREILGNSESGLWGV